MQKLEKVIKGLETCTDNNVDCSSCPYRNNCGDIGFDTLELLKEYQTEIARLKDLVKKKNKKIKKLMEDNYLNGGR